MEKEILSIKELLEETFERQFFWNMMMGSGHYDFFEELYLNLKHQYGGDDSV